MKRKKGIPGEDFGGLPDDELDDLEEDEEDGDDELYGDDELDDDDELGEGDEFGDEYEEEEYDEDELDDVPQQSTTVSGPQRDPTARGLQPHQPAATGWNAQRSGAVVAVRNRNHAGCHRGG